MDYMGSLGSCCVALVCSTGALANPPVPTNSAGEWSLDSESEMAGGITGMYWMGYGNGIPRGLPLSQKDRGVLTLEAGLAGFAPSINSCSGQMELAVSAGSKVELKPVKDSKEPMEPQLGAHVIIFCTAVGDTGVSMANVSSTFALRTSDLPTTLGTYYELPLFRFHYGTIEHWDPTGAQWLPLGALPAAPPHRMVKYRVDLDLKYDSVLGVAHVTINELEFLQLATSLASCTEADFQPFVAAPAPVAFDWPYPWVYSTVISTEAPTAPSGVPVLHFDDLRIGAVPATGAPSLVVPAQAVGSTPPAPGSGAAASSVVAATSN